MTNTFMNGLKEATNIGYTENGATTRVSTLNALYDLFAMGGSYRSRSDEDVILLWRNAYSENPKYALKCLFYLRDIAEGQGERRFFRVCLNDLAKQNTDVVIRNIKNVPILGRWDDLFSLIDTPAETAMFKFIRHQLALDVKCNTPSLLAKWLKSENTSSKESREIANRTRQFLKMNHKEYRKTLSVLRERIKVLERLMSENRWNEIEFDKIPSKAGLKYRNAFARRDMIKARYEAFANNKDTKVNARTLYPYEVVAEAFNHPCADKTDRAMINKYWDNLTDYFNKQNFDGLAVVDTSGSMFGQPLVVAISLGMYCAEKAKGPFAEHYISFSRHPQLVKVEGIDFYDKVRRIANNQINENTNIEAVFDLLLNTIKNNNVSSEDIPKNIIIISDMEFDTAQRSCIWGWDDRMPSQKTLMESIYTKWEKTGIKMPNLIFWNVSARHNNIPMRTENGITFVSGFNPIIFEMVMSGKTSYDLMFDKLNSERYKEIF